MAGINKEIWTSDIIDNLYKDNSFALRSIDRKDDVKGGTVVHTAVAGDPTGIKKNLTVFPQVATVRTDSDRPYALDALYALPRRIPNLDKYELSYDKRQSVVGEDMNKLRQEAHDNLLWRWAPTGVGATTQVIELDGDATGDDLIDDDATGTRTQMTKAVFKNAAKKLAKTEFGAFKKTALLTAAHYHQLLDSFTEVEATNFNNLADLKNGVIGRYMGVDIMMRSSVLRYREAGGVYTAVDTLDEGFTSGADDLSASLLWAENSVERALGDVDVFDNPGQALYYGDIFSAMMYFGGRIRRPKGVIALVEAVGA